VRLAEVEARRAHEIADVLDHEDCTCRRYEPVDSLADHVGVEVTALAGVDLDSARAGRADPIGVVARFLVALDDDHLVPVLKTLDGLDEQRRLPRPRAGDEVDGEDTARGEAGAVGSREGVVLGEDVPLDLHHPCLVHAGRVHARGPVAEMQVVVVITVVVTVLVLMRVIVSVVVRVSVRMAVHGAVGVSVLVHMVSRTCRLDPRLALSAPASGTHPRSPSVHASHARPACLNRFQFPSPASRRPR